MYHRVKVLMDQGTVVLNSTQFHSYETVCRRINYQKAGCFIQSLSYELLAIFLVFISTKFAAVYN